MKILLMGDYSACQLTLGRALSRMGHYVTLATEGSAYLDTERPYDLRRRLPGAPGGALLYAKLRWLQPLRGYDVVSIISPTFVQLRSARVRDVYDRLRRSNGVVFLNAAGTDKAMVDYYNGPGCVLRYHEWLNPDGTPNHRNDGALAVARLWQQGSLGALCEHIYDTVDGVTSSLYEYHLAMAARIEPERLAYTGLPVEMPTPVPARRNDGKIVFLLGRDKYRKAWKGTDILEEAARDAVRRSGGRAVLDIVENVPYSEYLHRLGQADVLIDQLYSYTPALNALLAMSRGRAAISGGEEDFYDFIGENELRPVINVRPDETSLRAAFDRCLNEDMAELGRQSRSFVARHNDAETVARRFLDFWVSKMK